MIKYSSAWRSYHDFERGSGLDVTFVNSFSNIFLTLKKRFRSQLFQYIESDKFDYQVCNWMAGCNILQNKDLFLDIVSNMTTFIKTDFTVLATC